ncbi:MAG: hypothetical protein ACRETM_13860, partial [Stenotrophobium sp.]
QSLPTRLPAYLGLVLLLPLIARAQMPPQTGAPPLAYTAHLPGISVFSGNDNVTVAIPIFSKKGRGLGFGVAMVYNSSMYWNPSGTAFVPDYDTDQYGGWMVEPGLGTLDYDQVSVSSRDGRGYCLYSYDDDFRYYTPDGTMHPLSGYLSSDGETTYPLPPGTCHQGTLSTTGTATDGSGWTMSVTASGGKSASVNITSELMTARDGTVFNPMAPANQPAVEDTNGNYLSFANPNSAETDWYDTSGTNPVAKIINQSNCTNPVDGKLYPSCVEFEVPNADGGYATWTAYMANISVNTGSCPNVSAYSGTMTVPIYLVMPEYVGGSHWYYGFSYGGAGRLTTLDYPTGGATTFTNSDPCTFPDGTLASVAVGTNDGEGHTGVTTYTRSSASQTTIARGDGSKAVVTYDASGLPTDVQNYDTDGATLLSETKYTNTGGTPDFPETATNFLNGVQVSEQETSFDSSGDLTQLTQIDDLNGDAERVTSIQYFAPGKPSKITVGNGSTTAAETVITYDDYNSPSGLVGPSIALDNHDTAYSTGYTTRGNPTEISRSVVGSATLNTYFVYDTGGNVVSTVEPNGHAVSATYDQCGGTYPSSIAVPGGTEAMANDCGTGLLTSSSGPNGHQTSYSYDSYGRPASVSYPDGGGKTLSYLGPAEVEVQTKITSGGLVKTQYLLADGYGHPIFAQAADAGACDTVAIEYDEMGRVSGVSLPYSLTCGGTSTTGAEFTTTTYDGLGRPKV